MRGDGGRMRFVGRGGGDAWVAIVALGGLGAVGCLSEGRRGMSDTGDADVAGDTGQDVDTGDADTGTDVDTFDPCLGKTCDDQDECTYDRCVPETGECEHLGLPSAGDPAMPPLRECADNAGCEDGDPCTTNTCVTWPGGCGNAGGSYCVTETIPGCGSCGSGCDDGNPCTIDTCAATGCAFAPIGDCQAECVESGTVSVSEAARNAQAGARVKVAGEVFAHPLAQACNDGPTCDCVGAVGLRDSANTPESLVARGTFIAPSGQEARWTCLTTGCTQVTTTCEPTKVEVRYRVWGTGLASWDLNGTGGVPAIPVPTGIAGVLAEDFCLETQRDSLTGQYAGLLEIGGYQIAFEALMYVENGNLWVKIGSGACRDCPDSLTLTAATVPVTVGDGWVQLEVTLPGFLGPKLETVRLYSNRNQLAGAYGLGSPAAAVAVPTGGHMALVRRPER